MSFETLENMSNYTKYEEQGNLQIKTIKNYHFYYLFKWNGWYKIWSNLGQSVFRNNWKYE